MVNQSLVFKVGDAVRTVCDTRAIGGMRSAHTNTGVVERMTAHRIMVRNQWGNIQVHNRDGSCRDGDTLTPSRIIHA